MSPQPHTVEICLVGTPADVTFWLDLLDDLTTLTEVTTPYQYPDGRLCVRATITRYAPLKGGPR